MLLAGWVGTLLLELGWQVKRRSNKSPKTSKDLPPLPLDTNHWQRIITSMKLAPREAEVAELKLRGAQLKQIAAILGIEVATVRSFQDRICYKAGIKRNAFFVHFLCVSHAVNQCACSRK